MPNSRRIISTAGAGLAAVAVAFTLAPPAVAATPGYRVTTDPVAAAAGWLAGQFVGPSHLPTPAGDHFDSKYGATYYPNYGENADVIFGLAAAHVAADRIGVALDYLERNADGYADLGGTAGGPYDGSVAKLALAEIVAGAPGATVAQRIALLKKDECAAVSATCVGVGSGANIFSGISQSFIVLAEARAGGASAAAVDYLLTLQCPSGGFSSGTSACTSGDEDVDATSYALMALQATGDHDAAVTRAADWLAAQRSAGGYWVVQGVANANSTGLAAAALAGAGRDVAAERSWLRRQQVPAGSAGAGAIRYGGTLTATTTSATSPSVLATAQALDGLVDGGSLATVSAAGASAAAPVFAPVATLASGRVTAGATQRATAHGFAPGEQVRVQLHSAPVTVATVRADVLGSVRATFTVPRTATAGAHSVVLTGVSSGLTASRALTVAAAATTTPTGGTTSTSGSGVDAASASATPLAATPSVAATGQDGRQVVALTVLGSVAVLAGAGLVLAGRRRAH